MAGILDPNALSDPQTQGLLQAAFAALQASGASRMPVSFGQALGQAGSAGVAGYDAAQQAKVRELQAQKLKLDLEFQKSLQEGEGGMGGILNDPDKLRAIGVMLKRPEFITHAERIEKQRANQAALGTMRSQEQTIAPDPQEAQQSADQGTPAVQPATAQRGGLFAGLMTSPHVGQEAGLLQSQLNAAPNADPEQWMRHYERLATAHRSAQEHANAALEREANLPKSTIVVADKTSPTGWSHKDTRTDRLYPGAPPPSAAANVPSESIVPSQHKDLHGDDYLGTLPSGMSSLVKSIAEGKVDPSKAASMRYGNREAIMQRVLQYDPTYNQTRPKVYQDFTTGKTSDNITAMNTAVAHMGTLDRLFDGLKNGNTQAVNAAVNTVRTQLGKPEVNNAELAVQAVGNELMRVFRQVGASEQETKAWEAKFTAFKGSPDQLKGALNTAAELLNGRLEAVNDRWKRGMNVETDYPVLSPKSKAVLAKFGIGTPDVGQAGGPYPDADKEKRYQEWKARQGK